MALSCDIKEQIFTFQGKDYNYNECRALMYDGVLEQALKAPVAATKAAERVEPKGPAAPKGAVDASDVDAMQGLMERHEGNNASGIPKPKLIGKVVNALRFLKNNNFAYDPKTGRGTRIFITENNDAQQRAVSEGIGREVEADNGSIISRYDEDGNFIGSDIYINLDSASENVVGHEMAHAVLVGLFGQNPKLFKEFVNVLKQSISKSELKTLNEFISAYEGADVQVEEFLAEFTGMIENMFASGEVGAKELSALRKLANAIKQFINKLTGGLVFPIEKESDVREFFNVLGSGIASGGELKKGAAEAAVKEVGFSKEQLQHFASDDASPEAIGGGTISPNYKASKSNINIYTDKQVSKLPVRSLEDVMSEFDNKIVLINSDPTRIGKLDLPSGKSIFMYGGPGYLSLKENTDGGVGFATTQESKVRTYQKFVKELWGGGIGLGGVVTQAPTSVFSNSYSLRYVLDAISTLPKNILRSSDFKSEFFGKDVTLLKDAFGSKSYDEFIAKYKNADFSSSEVIDMMIAEMGYKIGNDNRPASFKARGAFVSNLLAGIAVKNPKKFIAKELNERLGINQETVMREIAIPNLVDKYIEEGKWGYLVAGFKTDPNVDIKDIQEKGISHPLFNAKFPGKDAFFFDGAYLVDGMLESIQMVGPKGGDYTKKASQMLAGSMYVKGAAENKEGVFKYTPTKKETPTILGAEKPAGIKAGELAKKLNLPIISDKQFKEELEKKLKVPRIDLKSSKKTHKETGFISVPSMIEIVASNDPTYLGDVIEHIFTMGEKLLNGDVGIEDLAKAYMMAISSIRAKARPVDAFGKAIDMDIPAHFIEPGMLIRPEGAMAFLLTTDRGKKMLQNIKDGKLSQADADFVARAMKPFGMFSEGESKNRNLFGIPAKGQINLRNIGEFQALLKGGVKDTEQLLNATALLKGISLNKSGFVGNFIGIGTRGVIDAREIQGWLRGVIFRGQRVGMEAEIEKELNKPGKELSPLKKEILDRMRLVGEAFGLDPAVAAYVGHHMIWDAVAQEKTTHDGLYLAMAQNEDEFKAKLEKIEAREKPKAGAVEDSLTGELPVDVFVSEENSGIMTVTLKSSKRTAPPPKKTIKAYKLFRVVKNKPGKLFPLFVDASIPVEIDTWLDADIGAAAQPTKTGKLQVKSTLGPLAYRPGWHAGDLPMATHIGGKSSKGLKAPDIRPKDQVWAEVEMAADRDWQTEANKRGVNEKGKFIAKEAHITDQIPKDGYYRYKTNPNMTGNWIIGGSMKVNRILTDEEVIKINEDAGVSDLPRQKPFDASGYGFDVKPFISLKSSKKAPIMERVAELKKALNEDPDTEFYAYGHDAFSVYVAEKLLPKPSDKLKRLTESNSLGLNQDWHSVANVDGVYFGVTKHEDPDAISDEEDAAGFPKEFVWAYQPLALEYFDVEEMTSNSVEELFADMKETAEMLNEVEAKSTTLKSSKKAKEELPPDTPEENRRVITVAKRRLDKIEGDEKRATERDVLMGDPGNYVEEGDYRTAIDQARNFVAELYFKYANLSPVDFSKAVYEEVKGISNEVSKVVAYGELQASLDMYAESKKLSSKDRKEIQRISAKMVSDMAQRARKMGQTNAALALVYNNYGKFASLVQAEKINQEFTAKLNSTEGSEEGKTIADNIEEARDEIKETLEQNKEIAEVVDLAEEINDALEDGHAAKVAAGKSTPLDAPAPVTAEQLVNSPASYDKIISDLEAEVKRLDGLLAQVNKLYSSAAADAASYAQQVADLNREINRKNKLIDRLKDKKNEIAKERDKYKNQVDVLKQKIADLKDINKLLAQKRVGKDRLSPSKIEKLRQQLLDLALAGKLNDPDFDSVFAAITGGNFLTTQDRKAIEHMANALKYFESVGSKEMAQKYVKRLNDYLEQQSKSPWTAAKVAILLQSWFYNNVLSSIGTFFNAFTGSVLVSIPNATVTSINIALKDPKSGLGATLYGMLRMLKELPTAISKGAMNQRAYDSMGTSWTVDSVSKYADPFEVHVLNGFFTHWNKIKNNPSLVEKSKASIALLGSIVAQATRITALLKFIDPVLRHSIAAHMEGMQDYIKIKEEMRMRKTEPGIAEAWTPYFSPKLIKKIDEMAGVARADRSAAAFTALREVATMKSRGIPVPLDYARRRTSEIMREKRDAEQTLTTDKMAADMIMMWKPDGVLGYAWDKLGKKTAISEKDNFIKAFTKLALNLSVLPFLRISAQGVSEIQSTIPVIGGIAAAYGVAKNKDGEWYVGKKYSENVQDREFEIQRMQRRIALNILSSFVIASLFAEVFDVEDAEDDDEEAMNIFGMRKKITLDPNRKIDFTSDARGPKSANQGIMEGRANFSMRIRAGSNEEWSDWMSVRLAPHMTIPVAWLGRLSDDANRLYQKPAFGSGATPKRAALNEYFTSVPLSALGEVSFQTLPRFFSGLKYDAGAAAARMFMSPVAAIAQPSIYRDVVSTAASMADATRKGEYMPEGFIGTSKAMFSSLYGLNYSISPEVTDEYGLPIKAIDPIRSWWKNYTDIEKRSDDHPEVNLRWKYGNTFIEATPRSQRIENVPRRAKPGQEGVYSKNVELTKDQQELSSKLTKALLRNSVLSNYENIIKKADAARKDKYEMPGEIVADEINKRHRKTVEVATNVFAEIVAGKMSERDVINKINQLNDKSDKLSELIKGGKPLPKVQDEVQLYIGKESVRVVD